MSKRVSWQKNKHMFFGKVVNTTRFYKENKNIKRIFPQLKKKSVD